MAFAREKATFGILTLLAHLSQLSNPMKKLAITLLLLIFLAPIDTSAQRKSKKNASTTTTKAEKKDRLSSATLSGLKLRALGPALMSGRIGDFAVNPDKPSEYYVAVSSGGVWKTENAGITYNPLFDSQKSYSIGCITLDPQNPHVVWVGTGENNAQRSVAYGDGIYKSINGGKSWKNVGLKHSNHIGKIIVHPKNSEIVYVAAQGPLWSKGGERGVYKTTDGGKSWKAVLTIDEHTGVTDIVMDPRDPNVLYAAAWQRRRHVWTYISGGPASAIYKTTDGGKNWKKQTSGLPSGDVGRIGLAISPVNPDYLYAIIEAANNKGGFFRSTNRGESWEKRSSHSTIGLYYQEIFCDPQKVDKVYSMNTFAQVTEDGGKTFSALGERNKHVDNHALWIDPNNTDHLLMGCDGGIYESYDRGKFWGYKANLPITQFYKVTTDNDTPFYNIYGGTQDNSSLGGPSRTTNAAGILNTDWYITKGGDGFESAVDPENPNIVYAQSQYGVLVRYDKQSGERISIQPQAGKGEPGLRYNWDAPLIISPHANTRIYFAANMLFRSDDRGNSWQVVSPDLTRKIDRNKLLVMDKVWGMDAVAKNASTSMYGNITALSESPLQEGLIYIGTDDGLIQVTEDGGKNWRKTSSFAGVPDRTYINALLSSQHDKHTVYAVFNNHKNGDFNPYLLKSTDAGKSWTRINANLPERGSTYSIAEDHIDANLLFVGTEFGLFFSSNAGKKWTQLKSGLPTIAVRDLDIQKRENDLVLATFGRGFYVLDDYSALRGLTEEVLAKDAHIFPIKDALLFVQRSPLGYGKGSQGESLFTASNPPVAAVFTYYLKESLTTLKQKRQKAEAAQVKKKEAVYYPKMEDIRAEDDEEKPYLLFTVSDEDGKVVRRIKTAATKGVKRVNWDFRYPSTAPVSLRASSSRFGRRSSLGHRVAPGDYYVSMSKSVDGVLTELVPKQKFTVKALENTTLPAVDRKALAAFQHKAAKLGRVIRGASQLKSELDNKVRHIDVALQQSPEAPLALYEDVKALKVKLKSIERRLLGDRSVSKLYIETPPSVLRRIEWVIRGLGNSTSAPTKSQEEAYTIAEEEFKPIMAELNEIASKDMKALEEALEAAGAPWTPGRVLGMPKQ